MRGQIFPQGFIVEAVKTLRGYSERRNKKNPKTPNTEVVIPNHKLNIKALSSCHAALLYHRSLPLEEFWFFTLTCFANVNYKHFCAFFSPDTAGVCTLSHFPQKSCRHRGAGAASAPRGAPLWLLGKPQVPAGAAAPSSKPGNSRERNA